MIRKWFLALGLTAMTAAAGWAQSYPMANYTTLSDRPIVGPRRIPQDAPAATSDCGGGCGTGCGTGCGGCGNACCDPCCSRYLTLFGGWVGVQDFSDAPPASNFNQIEASFNDGWGIGGAAGRRLTDRLCGELEFAYRNNEGDAVTVNQNPFPLDGDLNCYSGMMNLRCEFGDGRGRITPYAGAGAGFAYLEGESTSLPINYSVEDSAFAYQAFAGCLLPLGACTDWFCEYRFFGTDEVALNDPAARNPPIGFDYHSNNIFFGIRFCR